VAATPGEPTTPQLTEALRSFVAAPVADRLEEEGGHLQEQRRLITALFADISGFTPLADRLDPEELLEIIDPVVSALSSVVGRYEGFVEKFAGDALLALFGAPVSHDNDAARALIVALEMHRTLADLRQELPHDARELTLHIGVNSGHGIARLIGSSVRTDYGVLGDSVILAQRLESAAPPGETYVSESTHALTSSGFEFEPVGELTLKGKTEPVRAWRLVGERRELARTSEPLFGRHAELESLTDRIGALQEGDAGVVAVLGEPGVGKSRLVEAARSIAAERGLRWLDARCLSYGAGLAYWPIVDLLRREAAIDRESPEEIVLARLGEMLPVDPEDVALVAGLLGFEMTQLELEPEAVRRRVHATVVEWLGSIGQADGLVLSVEDVHWADSATAALLAEIARNTGNGVLLLVTGRPEARDFVATLNHLLLSLDRLDDAAVANLVAAELEASPPASLVDFVIRRSGGNPFFVRELVRALRERGATFRQRSKRYSRRASMSCPAERPMSSRRRLSSVAVCACHFSASCRRARAPRTLSIV